MGTCVAVNVLCLIFLVLFAGLRLVIVGLPCQKNLFLITYYARGNIILIFKTKTLNGGIFDLPNNLVICM